MKQVFIKTNYLEVSKYLKINNYNSIKDLILFGFFMLKSNSLK